MAKAKAPHPEDLMLAQQVKRATRWSACLHLGPGNRSTVYVEEAGQAGYDGAVDAAARLNVHSKFGRKAVVYAINALGSFPVDDKLARLAGFAQ